MDQVYLLTGYRPDYAAEVDRLARDYSHTADILRAGPNLLSDHLDEIRRFISQAPYADSSSGRTLLINMEGCSYTVQTQLLILLENPPKDARIILHVPNRAGLLSTVVSRCVRKNFNTPSSAQITVDLYRTGVDPSLWPTFSKQIVRGFSLSQVHDDYALTLAERLIDAAIHDDIDMGIRTAKQFDPRELVLASDMQMQLPEAEIKVMHALAALRERISVKYPGIVQEAYGPYDAYGVAIHVLRRLLPHRK